MVKLWLSGGIDQNLTITLIKILMVSAYEMNASIIREKH
jgi:hypothetical protein